MSGLMVCSSKRCDLFNSKHPKYKTYYFISIEKLDDITVNTCVLVRPLNSLIILQVHLSETMHVLCTIRMDNLQFILSYYYS